MVMPFLLEVLSLVLPYNINGWANISMADSWLIINLIALLTYPGYFIRFLLAVSNDYI